MSKISKKVYSERIYSALIDLTPHGGMMSVKSALEKHHLSRSIQTMITRCGFTNNGNWVGGFPTMEQAEKVYDSLMEYQKQAMKRQSERKKKERASKQNVETLFHNPNTMTESQALDVLKNSRLYDYKVFRSPKKSIEEQVL